jgi:hypothetical protein
MSMADEPAFDITELLVITATTRADSFAVPSDAPRLVRDARDAVNRVAVFEGRDNASVAWDKLPVRAEGGRGLSGRDRR